MNKFLQLVLTLSLIFTVKPATAQNSRYTLNVGDFAKLVVEDGINVEYHSSADSAGYAVFYTTNAVADKIIFENNGKGQLKILKGFHEPDEMIKDLPTIIIYSRFLKEAKNYADSTLRIINPTPTIEINATVAGNGKLTMRNIECSKFNGSVKTGNGTLTVSGRCETAALNNTGTGSIQADNLQAVNVNARFLGTGSTGCWATDQITVKGLMHGKLYYRGEPKNIRNYSGGAKIYSLEGKEWHPTKKESKKAEE